MEVELEAGEVFTIPLRVSVERAQLDVEKTDLTFKITSKTDPLLTATEESPFIGPAVKSK